MYLLLNIGEEWISFVKLVIFGVDGQDHLILFNQFHVFTRTGAQLKLFVVFAVGIVRWNAPLVLKLQFCGLQLFELFLPTGLHLANVVQIKVTGCLAVKTEHALC